MPTSRNKPPASLRVPLPGGKKLHLGPGQTGQVSPKAVDHPAVSALVDAGKIEITDEGQTRTGRSVGAHQATPTGTTHHSTGGTRSTGDR